MPATKKITVKLFPCAHRNIRHKHTLKPQTPLAPAPSNIRELSSMAIS